MLCLKHFSTKTRPVKTSFKGCMYMVVFVKLDPLWLLHSKNYNATAVFGQKVATRQENVLKYAPTKRHQMTKSHRKSISEFHCTGLQAFMFTYCPSPKTPIWPLLTGRHRDYMILLLAFQPLPFGSGGERSKNFNIDTPTWSMVFVGS